ncbi:peroxiredoxin family protein [Marinicella gelatinilytica]|uniref:peroxiredoxin family protein n=1 Tax=Marinicella gelatinilytica TaxID=2996017 RepID=UPI002260D2BA|nr:TlpA disulfide reductase family protein [Marinicella gelatinilytica]MCX7545759.1 TlpA disulfide reductase family protein [Marinicella gelatinilytica]
MLKTYKKLRENKYNALLMDAVFIVMVLVAFSWWQNKGTLAAKGQQAPDFNLASLNGDTYQLSDYRGRQVLVYFFAPWCHICRASAPNLNDLRAARSEEDVMIFMIAQSYESIVAVEEFVADLDLAVPVLIGGEQQMLDYKIKGFPSYYVINEQGELASRSIGYSTELGMRLRTR